MKDNQFPIVEQRQIKTGSEADVVISLEELIKSHIATIDRLTEEKKKFKEIVDDGFNNDVGYREQKNRVSDEQKALKQIRSLLLTKTNMLEATNKVKSLMAELKEKRVSLSDYLLEYKRLTQATQLELFNGDIVEIVEVAKVLKKK